MAGARSMPSESDFVIHARNSTLPAGPLIGERIKGHFRNHADVRVLDEPEFANAEGYMRYGTFLSAQEA